MPVVKPPLTPTLPTTYIYFNRIHFVEDLYFAKTESQTCEEDFVVGGDFLVFVAMKMDSNVKCTRTCNLLGTFEF